MSAQHTPGIHGRTQSIDGASFSMSGWESFCVTTRAHGDVESRCELRTPIQALAGGGTPFLDVCITEYVGTSRRAKLCSVRLQEEAARKLYAVLAAKFGGASC